VKKYLIAALMVLLLGGGAVLATAWVGGIDVAADEPHHPLVSRFIAWAREQSISRAAAGIVPPADLGDGERIRRGAGNYDAMCADCHLAPGVGQSEIRLGLYPMPPDLTRPSAIIDTTVADARRFWIIKHGIKASGMPAWSRGGMDDEAIWDLTAFLKAMPNFSPAAYRRQVEASDGHAHAGRDGQDEHGRRAAAEPVHRAGRPASHAHRHDAHGH
jgi:cytochrome c553